MIVVAIDIKRGLLKDTVDCEEIFSALKDNSKHELCALMRNVLTCICVIHNLNSFLGQIYYSVHFKHPQVLLIQSNVSQKGS